MIPAIQALMLAVSSSLAASIVAKVTVALAFGLITSWLARGNRAAVRHALLAAMFGVILLLPLASVVLPPLHVGVPVGGDRWAASPPLQTRVAADPSVTTDARVRARAATPEALTLSLSVLLFAGWIAGTVLFLLPVMIGLWQIRSLGRSSLPWQRGRAAVARLAPAAGIDRGVEVLLHETLPGPMTCGVVHPAIVLPQDAENWNEEDLNRAIVHELEHVRRGDFVSRCLARAACAVYWFHPLVWIAWRKLVLEAERSCDDAVLRHSEPTAYAEQLVELAKRLSMGQRSQVVAMANRSDLAMRVGAVLDGRQQRGRAGMFSLVLACAAAVALVVAIAPLMLVAAPQAAGAPMPQFEVASIKPFAPGQGPTVGGLHIDGSQIRAVALSLKDYLSTAYNIKALLISGPDWTATERFDISATLPAGSTRAQIPEMLQALLADRFQVKLHKDKKEFPVYALVPGKGPLKLKEPPPDPTAEKNELRGTFNNATIAFGDGITISYVGGSSFYFGHNRVEAKKLNMSEFTRDLERFADRQIVDMTGLAGQYDFSFEFSPEDEQAMMLRSLVWVGQTLPPQAQQFLEASSPSALSDALQQVGLKLEPRKAPLDVLVIDDALKTPTAN